MYNLYTDHKINPDEWDDVRQAVKTDGSEYRQAYLRSVMRIIDREMERLTAIVRRKDAHGVPYRAEDVAAEFGRYIEECSLPLYIGRLIARMRYDGRVRTSETYRAALGSFRKFLEEASRQGRLCESEGLMLDCLSAEIMEAYEAWNLRRGNSPNTVSFYNRVLRAVYNRAVDEGITDDRAPFRHVYTGVGKTIKRAVPLSVLRKIKALDLSGLGRLDFARDMFMMSFYLRGMSFIDMAFLKESDLRGGYVVYRRRKTGQQLTIAWTAEMQGVVDKYGVNPAGYLLPIIRVTGVNERCAYRNAAYNINRSLKTVAIMAGITIPLTMYVARHSWASVAKAAGIPLGVISEGMGHDRESTTRIYLASLDTSAVDAANSLILSSL
ncbi:MAG: site-specific integrase [Terasakiella sp.]|nr:site-specific integrase [Terasakiella sp.]